MPFYHGIVRIHGGSIFMIFMGSPFPQIDIFDMQKTNFGRALLLLHETENRLNHEITAPGICK